MSTAYPKRPTGGLFLTMLLLVFLILYGGVLGVQRALIRRQALADAEDKAQATTSLLLQDLEETAPLSDLLPHLDDPVRLRYLDHLVRSRTQLFGLSNSKIYDREGTILYAEDGELTGLAFPDREEFQVALAGGIASRVLTAREYEAVYGVRSPTAVVETYVSFHPEGAPGSRYVFEAYQSFEPTRARLHRLMLLSGGSLALMVGLALGILAFVYRRIHRLEAHVESLESLLPICAYCKKIRVEQPGAKDLWMPVEEFFRDRDRVEFTHGMCGECLEKNLAEVARRRVVPGSAPERGS